MNYLTNLLDRLIGRETDTSCEDTQSKNVSKLTDKINDALERKGIQGEFSYESENPISELLDGRLKISVEDVTVKRILRVVPLKDGEVLIVGSKDAAIFLPKTRLNVTAKATLAASMWYEANASDIRSAAKDASEKGWKSFAIHPQLSIDVKNALLPILKKEYADAKASKKKILISISKAENACKKAPRQHSVDRAKNRQAAMLLAKNWVKDNLSILLRKQGEVKAKGETTFSVHPLVEKQVLNCIARELVAGGYGTSAYVRKGRIVVKVKTQLVTDSDLAGVDISAAK